jgi:hypothetical protein
MIATHGWVHETRPVDTSFLDLVLIASAGALIVYGVWKAFLK